MDFLKEMDCVYIFGCAFSRVSTCYPNAAVCAYPIKAVSIIITITEGTYHTNDCKTVASLLYVCATSILICIVGKRTIRIWSCISEYSMVTLLADCVQVICSLYRIDYHQDYIVAMDSAQKIRRSQEEIVKWWWFSWFAK